MLPHWLYMAKGIHKRIQPDLVDEIEECEGGSFSEKLRNWKYKDIEELTDKFEASDNGGSLSKSDVVDAVERALPSSAFK